MCNRAAARFTLEGFVQLKLTDFADPQLDRPRLNIAPNGTIPLIAHDGQGGMALVPAVWGDPTAPPKISTFNARDDRLDTAPMWRTRIGKAPHHGVIVVSDAFEPFTRDTIESMGEAVALELLGRNAVELARSGETVWHRLQRTDGHPLLIPALVDTTPDGRRWATMVTTAGGPVFSRIHRAKNSGDAREIVSLRDREGVQAWMHPEDHPTYRSLLRPSTPDHMAVFRCPPDCMKQSADPLLRFQTWKPPVERRLF